MLHIHNGDSSADTARQSSLPGEHFAFREALIEGPTPAGVEGVEWRIVRARHLWSAYGVDLNECGRELLAQEMKLASFDQHDEIVLWFEHDLSCQVHLIYLLDWFGKQARESTKLSMICINEFPGKEDFRSLGDLSPEQLASLFPARREVTNVLMGLAASAWRAYCSPDPTDIEKVLQTDTSPLPFLEAALRAHLERFPATRNGLGRIENRALELVNGGLDNFADLFPRFGDTEPIYGLGDAQFWLALRRVSEARQPLLTIAGIESCEPGQRALTPEIVQNAKFEITKLGESSRKGIADFVALNGIDLWLGGVHLDDKNNLWRWDEQSRTIVSGQSR